MASVVSVASVTGSNLVDGDVAVVQERCSDVLFLDHRLLHVELYKERRTGGDKIEAGTHGVTGNEQELSFL